MEINSKSSKSDALANLYRSALFLTRGQVKIGVEFFKKTYVFFGDLLPGDLKKSIENIKSFSTKQRLLLAEKILDQYHLLKNN